MDPATAIGTASAILSFIDFTWGLVNGAREIYKSADGTLADNAKIKEMANNLQGLTNNLGTRVLGNSKLENDLRGLTSDCSAMSNELLVTLQKLQSTGGIRNAVKAKLRTIRKKDQIGSARGRLVEYTSQITLMINTLLLDQQSGIKSQLDSMQSVESQSATTTIQKLKDIRESLTLSLGTAMSTQKDITVLRSQAQTGVDMISQQTTILNQVRLDLDKLRDLTKVILVEKRILQYVFYKSMYDREDAIHDAEEGTFEWLLEGEDDDSSSEYTSTGRVPSAGSGSDTMFDSNSDDESRIGRVRENKNEEDPPEKDQFEDTLSEFENNQQEARSLATEKFITWLQHGSGVFHLSGKAGSGKSTAMKLIAHHKRTREELVSWAGDKHLVTSDHYFWSNGNEMQRSLEGLYRSILFDILRQCPSLIPAVFPEQWTALGGDPQRGSGDQGTVDIEEALFRKSKIEDAFDRLVTKRLDGNLYVCLFIDGLDEFQGDPLEHRRLAEKFRDWSNMPNTKCLLSSRPYPEFHSTFPEETRLHLHLLNERDIYMFSLHMFERDTNIKRIRSFYKRLVRDVVLNSEGIFLWALLVVRILLRSAGYDPENILFQKLQRSPKELEKLYETLLEPLEPLDRQRADKMLIMALNDANMELPLSTLAYSWLDMLENPLFPFADTYCRSIDQLTEQCESVEQRIASLTKGLLEIHPSGFDQDELALLGKKVQFMHRTVADYLTGGDVLACKSSFKVAESYCRLRVAEIAAFRELKLDNEKVMITLVTNMFIKTRHHLSYNTDTPSYHFMKRMETDMPFSFPPILVVIKQRTIRVEDGSKLLTGQKLSIPHLGLGLGMAEYVLSRLSSTPEATPRLSGLNFLLSWLYRRDCGPDSYSDATHRLLSHGFHLTEKVRLYRSSEYKPVPPSEGTVWMVFVIRLWHHISGHLKGGESTDCAEAKSGTCLRPNLEDLAVFLDNGADPDVVISLQYIFGGPVYYISLVDTIRALRRRYPTLIDYEGAPWKEHLSGQDVTLRTSPYWARKIPEIDPQAQFERALPEGNQYVPTYFCSREECIPAEFKFRIC